MRVSSTSVRGVVGAVPGRTKSEWVLISHLRLMECREKKDAADAYGGMLWYAVCVCVCGGSLLPYFLWEARGVIARNISKRE